MFLSCCLRFLLSPIFRSLLKDARVGIDVDGFCCERIELAIENGRPVISQFLTLLSLAAALAAPNRIHVYP